MKKFIAGNWKMNKNKQEALDYLVDFKLFSKNVDDTDIILAVPFTILEAVSKECKGTNIKIAAQNLCSEESGAFTGEISAKMIKDFAEYVIIGHSERRKYFNESNDLLNKKINTALKNNLKIIFCLGETQEQKNNNQTNSIIETQLREGLSGFTQDQIKNIVIADKINPVTSLVIFFSSIFCILFILTKPSVIDFFILSTRDSRRDYNTSNSKHKSF